MKRSILNLHFENIVDAYMINEKVIRPVISLKANTKIVDQTTDSILELDLS